MIRRDERGFAAAELVAGVALLLLPVVLVVVSLPRWSERQGLARVAAREAARVVGLHGRCQRDVAEAVVRRIADDAGIGTTALQLTLDCTAGAPLPRGGMVTAHVAVEMPALDVPMIGSALSWSWTAGHREPIDPYGSRP